MILGDPGHPPLIDGVHPGTLDDLFRRAAVRNPEAIALIDPVNRTSFTDGAPRQLTYIEADRIVWAIAARLRRLAFPTDTVIALQLANTVESVLTLLGIMRAGMIAAPLPMLWRERDAGPALSQVSAKLLIGCSRIGATDHIALLMQMAAQVFAIRHVCAFGKSVPDGIGPLDDVFAAENGGPLPVIDRGAQPSAHVAAITFDTTANGTVAVARNHAELIAGGLSVFLESRLPPDARILSALPLSSFAGFSLALLPWLLSGGTLVLHQPFEPDIFAEQRALYDCDVAIVPSATIAPLTESRHLEHLQHIIALWRSPERLANSEEWSHAAKLTDVVAFGEVGVLAARRDAGERPQPLSLGAIAAPRGASLGVRVAEATRMPGGTFALRGPMVPEHPFPPGAERGAFPCLTVGHDGFVDTGFSCRPEGGGVVITGAPCGLTTLGGYRLPIEDAEALVKSVDPEAILAAVPDALSGGRLGGAAADRDAVHRELLALGANPLVAGAFRPRNAA